MTQADFISGDRSDTKSVTGSHPAVIGVDLNSITNGDPIAQECSRERLKKIVEDTYNRGGVITVAWHFSNPVSGGGFMWVDSLSKPAVKYIIPGGQAHHKHYYVPFPGHQSAADFIRFYNEPYTLFEKDLKGIYR